MSAIRVVGLVLVAVLVVSGSSAGWSESKTADDKSHLHAVGEHQSYGALHAAINRSALQDADKSRLHEAVGHIADTEMRQRHAAALRRDYERETNAERKRALEQEIERQDALYKSAQADANTKLQEAEEALEGTHVFDTIANLISQVNTIISNAVRD